MTTAREPFLADVSIHEAAGVDRLTVVAYDEDGALPVCTILGVDDFLVRKWSSQHRAAVAAGTFSLLVMRGVDVDFHHGYATLQAAVLDSRARFGATRWYALRRTAQDTLDARSDELLGQLVGVSDRRAA